MKSAEYVETPMRELPGGTFLMGSEDFYPEESPVHLARVGSFAIDIYPVTNTQFAAFVAATGYLTVAERALSVADFPQLSEAERTPGSLAFAPTKGPVDLNDWRAWWRWQEHATWRAPFGPGSSIEGKEEHPVVQVSHEDAQAFASWANKRLPTEAEFEYAARGGLESATYSWGNAEPVAHDLPANTWQGKFPYLNTGANGFVGTSAVGSFRPNEFGLYDMCGNVWEWTSSVFTADHRLRLEQAAGGCGCGCAPSAKPGSSPQTQLVLKGGSHLCAPEYCHRYRPAARSPQSPDSATTHLGFRCVK